MKKLTTKWFRKWSRKANLSDERLLHSVSDLEKGFSTAELGGHLYKIRVKRDDGGKRTGYRTIIVFRKNDRAIFLYGFGKNEKGNIDKKELLYFKKLAGDLLTLSSSQLIKAIEEKVLFDLEDSK
ncbi:MAG: type II toxin-antitoxin system RelE/ParE family toxin [Candidatus Sabulitectum sp.]|nr:type II toxin-antitoxin system RelE/ParE family toxin [Candidatus Sabulitectum sp.]